MIALERADVERFRTLIAQRLGLQFDDAKLDLLADVLRRRLEETGTTSTVQYLQRLLQRAYDRAELRALAERLTVGETYFFRGQDHFRVFAEVALPARIRAQTAWRRLRILSAGCASGEEAHSLAILIRDQFPDLSSWHVSILGIDVNPAMIDKAATGRYSDWSLRETDDNLRERWFVTSGREHTLKGGARGLASFEERNLLEEDPDFWKPGAFDVVFCRNVIMYFSVEAGRAVAGRIARALAPGGYLFLGHAETLRGVSQDFHLRHTHETFYYQSRGASESPTPGEALVPFTVAPSTNETWVDEIGRASERIATLASGTRDFAETPAPPTTVASQPTLSTAMDLLSRERFADALDCLGSLPEALRDDSDARLLQAILLTNSGRLADAESACRRLLERDELNVGAHYLMALAREHAGDLSAAVEHDQAAVYLDPSFAMARLHLGLLARRAGDLARAQRELAQALILLGREEASRVLLFGGGFTREALAQLCHAELRAAGAL